MSTVILDSFESENNISMAIKKLLIDEKEELSYFKLKDMSIKRCRGCGACGDKTPGRCIIDDDMQQVYRAIAKGDSLIILTPLRFGGYSSQLKIAVDRFMVLGLPFYFVKKGILFHRTRYGHKYYIGIALEEDNLQGQEENFRNIVSQNAANLSYTGKSIVFKQGDTITEIEDKMSKLLQRGERQ
jgi:multimeric flavodoxin WrbA